MISKEQKAKLIDDFKLSDADTGSIEVQVALLTDRINTLQGHLGDNKKDFSSKRGMLKLVTRRKKFLKYLQEHEPEKYADLISRLGLRK